MWKLRELVIPDAVLLPRVGLDRVVTETDAPHHTVIASVAKQSIHRRVRRDPHKRPALPAMTPQPDATLAPALQNSDSKVDAAL
jgi:hypothetical protein